MSLVLLFLIVADDFSTDQVARVATMRTRLVVEQLCCTSASQHYCEMFYSMTWSSLHFGVASLGTVCGLHEEQLSASDDNEEDHNSWERPSGSYHEFGLQGQNPVKSGKTCQSGSPKDFAHANKCSILAADDNEFTGECCASFHTSRSQCQQRRFGDERVDECIRAPETKVSSHQRGSGSSKSSAHRVSYFAASGADSKGVHHVSGSGGRRMSAIMYSSCGRMSPKCRDLPTQHDRKRDTPSGTASNTSTDVSQPQTRDKSAPIGTTETIEAKKRQQ